MLLFQFSKISDTLSKIALLSSNDQRLEGAWVSDKRRTLSGRSCSFNFPIHHVRSHREFDPSCDIRSGMQEPFLLK